MTQMHPNWKRLGTGFAAAIAGAAIGAFVGLLGAFVAVKTGLLLTGSHGHAGEGALVFILLGAPFGASHGAIVGMLVGLGARNIRGWVVGALVGLAVGLGLWTSLWVRRGSDVTAVLALLSPLLCGAFGAAVQAYFPNSRKHNRRRR